MLNSYETMQRLVAEKLAVVSTNSIYDTFKYHRRVMYDALWSKHPELLECRGHVYDNTTGKLVQAAPRKSFNYLEFGHWSDVSQEQEVVLYKKFNGFMAAATVHKGIPLISSTGSTTSDYVKLAKEHLKGAWLGSGMITESYTTLFEIIDESDPHIVSEKIGPKLLGYRNKSNGEWWPITPAAPVHTMKLKDVKSFLEFDRGEGYMMYKSNGGQIDTTDCCKVKTPYYVGKKILMRLSKNNIDKVWAGSRLHIPEMWYHLVRNLIIKHSAEDWFEYPEQFRRKLLEEYFEEA